MKRVALWVTAVVVAAGTGWAQSPPSAAGTAGCLGVAVTTCVASLQRSMNVDTQFLAGTLANRQHVDVNGRRLGGTIKVSGTLPDRLDPVVFLLHLTPDDRVTAAESTLLENPLTAKTEQGYADTALYDVTIRLLGNRCPELTPLNLYRFFENTVKPNVLRTQEDSGGIFSSHRQMYRAARIPFCGVRFTFTQTRTFSGSTDPSFSRGVRNFFTIRVE